MKLFLLLLLSLLLIQCSSTEIFVLESRMDKYERDGMLNKTRTDSLAKELKKVSDKLNNDPRFNF